VWSRCYGEACELWRARWRSAPDDLNLNEGHSIACPPQPVFAHSASLWRQKLFVFGGRHTETYSDSLSMLDLSAPSPRWGEVATLGAPPSKRRAHTATVCDGRLYILGGGVAHAETCGDMHSVSLTPPHTWRAEPSPARWRRFGHTSVLVASPPASPPTRRRAPPLWSPSPLATGLALEALEAGVREALEVQAARGVAGGDLIVFGGASYRPGAALEGDSITRAYDVRRARWRELSTRGSEPRPRYRHAAALLPAPAAGAGAAMAVWGGYLRRMDEGSNVLATNELFLLRLHSLTWEAPRTSGPSPEPRGGHTASLIGDKILIFGGGQLTLDGEEERWNEHDLPGLAWLDTSCWAYGAPATTGEEPGARGGHTAHVIGHDGAISLLILGGRRYEAGATGRHHGRAEAHVLQLGG